MDLRNYQEALMLQAPALDELSDELAFLASMMLSKSFFEDQISHFAPQGHIADEDAKLIGREWTRLFRGTPSKQGSVKEPCEVFWRDDLAGNELDTLVDISNRYKSAGLKARGEVRSDSLPMELMFVANLLRAISDGSLDENEGLSRIGDFYDAHLSRWAFRYIAYAKDAATLEVLENLLDVMGQTVGEIPLVLEEEKE